VKSVTAAARHGREQTGREESVFDGFNFHWLRHTAGSLMAVAGLDPAVASERMAHTDGGALFLSTYRHLYEGEKRVQAGEAGSARPCELGQGRAKDFWGWAGTAQRSRIREWAELVSAQTSSSSRLTC
jgi:hypothetical protein